MGVSLNQLTLRLMVRVRPRLVCLHLARPLVTTFGVLAEPSAEVRYGGEAFALALLLLKPF